MKIFKYHSVFEGEILHQMTSDFGESNTDKSAYVPDIVEKRSYAGSDSGSNVELVYDFEDGKDTGDTIATYLRMQGLDRAEIDTIGEILKSRVDSGQERDVKQFEDDARTKVGEELLNYAREYIKNNPLPTTVESASSNATT